MKISENKKTKDKTSLKIEGNLNIYSANEFKKGITPYLTGETNLELDLSKVDKMDTAGFQLLLLLDNSLKSRKKMFSVKTPSKEVESILSLYGENFNQE